MFTGITRGLFPVEGLQREPDLLRFGVALGSYGAGLEPGASVAIDGVCQTVVRQEGSLTWFDAIRETLDKTTLHALALGDEVSVERSARVGDEIGGHRVSGHVVGTGEVVARRAEGHDVALEIRVPEEWMRYVMKKGFIAIDGSSLTVGETTENTFMLYLIPETLRLTKLGRLEEGARVNVELDPMTVAIVDTVERVLERDR